MILNETPLSFTCPCRGVVSYGTGTRMLTLTELCEWLNITERHARKLVERDAIPYRKVGRLLRFPEAEIEEWSHPSRKTSPQPSRHHNSGAESLPKRRSARFVLPKTLIE